MKTFITLICVAILGILAGCAQAISAPLSVALSWTAPTTFTNGSAITGAITYNIYQGASGAEVSAQTGVSATSVTITTGLSAGSTVCWQVTAVVGGVESSRTTEVCETFPAQPNPPTNLTVK